MLKGYTELIQSNLIIDQQSQKAFGQMQVNHFAFSMLGLYLTHHDGAAAPGDLCSLLSFLPASEVGPTLKRHFQLGVSTDPAVGPDVPAPLNSFNRIGPSPQQ